MPSTVLEAEIEQAVEMLGDRRSAIGADDWPPTDRGINQPGMYSWWVDSDGAQGLTAGLGEPVRAGLVYTGQAGATAWPSGKRRSATLASRIGEQHVRGGIRSSTFRLTLASALLRELDLIPTGSRKLARASERQLGDWIARHMSVVTHPFPNRDALGELEDRVLAMLDPPLNLKGRPTSAVRKRLSELRATLLVAPGEPGP